MKFKKHFTVRWHDTDAMRVVSASRLLEMMQETVTYHCRAYGHDLDNLRDEKGIGFVLVRLSLEILSPLYALDEIEIETWVTESRGLSFNRCYTVKRGDTVIANAISVWALLHLADRRFLRVTDHDFGFIPEPPPTLSPSIPLRLHIPPDTPFTDVGKKEILYADLDYNMHMNNTRYPDMLSSFLENRHERRVTSVVLSYLHEARYRDTLSILRTDTIDPASPEETVHLFRAVGADGITVTEARITTASAADL